MEFSGGDESGSSGIFVPTSTFTQGIGVAFVIVGFEVAGDDGGGRKEEEER